MTTVNASIVQQLGHAGVEVALDRRQRDVQRGDVEADEEEAQAADREDRLPTGR